MEIVKIPRQKGELSARLFRPELVDGLRRAILFIHGWQSGQDRFFEFAEALSRAGFVCLTFDLSGHGESGGFLSELAIRDFLEDAVAAYDFLAQVPGVNAGSVSVVGSSFGAYLGAILTSKRAVKKLVLRAPANYSDEEFDKPKSLLSKPSQERRKWRSLPLDFKGALSLRSLNTFEGNILIVESGQDDEVPGQTVKNYANAVKDNSKLTYVIMENAPHAINKHPEFVKQFNKLTADWLLSP